MTLRSNAASQRAGTLLRWMIPAAALAAISIWLAASPEGALGKLDAVGYAVCHRISARSFTIEGRQLPMCARCTGEFAAAAVAMVFQAWRSGRATRLPSRQILVVLAVFGAAFAVDGLNSFLYLVAQNPGAAAAPPNLYLPNNTLRLITGSGMGIAMAAMLFPLLNQSIWSEPGPNRALGTRDFLVVLAIASGLDALILSEHPVILYTAGALSTIGVLLLLGTAFSVLWITALRQENSFQTRRQLWVPAWAGLTLSLLLIGSIDLLRYRLTGTWGGFPGLTGA